MGKTSKFVLGLIFVLGIVAISLLTNESNYVLGDSCTLQLPKVCLLLVGGLING